jgi:hypothetical protein
VILSTQAIPQHVKNELRIGKILVALALIGTCAQAQRVGIGGVLVRDIPIPSDEEEWPQVLPAGGLVAFGAGRDWSILRRKEGFVAVHFVIRELDGERDSGEARIPEDAVHIFTWPCGEQKSVPFDRGNPIICNPTIGAYGWSNDWQQRFVTTAQKLAQEMGLVLIKEFDVNYAGSQSTGSSTTRCTVSQILTMKDAGLSDAQIKAACGE